MLPLSTLGVDSGRLPLAPCGPCGRETLAWLDVTDDGRELLRCTGCGEAVNELGLREAGERTVERLGYAFVDRKKKSKSASKLSGCGAKGVRSCGTGGCSSGGCSTGGGGGCGGGCGG